MHIAVFCGSSLPPDKDFIETTGFAYVSDETDQTEPPRV